MNYFLIPGNPPAVHFYEKWSEEIRSLNSANQAIVSPYPEVKPEPDSQAAMEKMTRTHLFQLEAFHDIVKGPVVIIGHSLGSYFALELLRKKPELVQKVFLVFPFLRKPGMGGRAVLEVASVVSMSANLQKFILEYRRLLHPLVPELSFVTDEELKKAAVIARHEARTIALDCGPLILDPDQKSKIMIFHTKNDWWCGVKFISKVPEGIKTLECPEPHNFAGNRGYREKIFQRILSNLL